MKATNEFKQIIKNYLDNRAQNDELFAVSYQKPNKSLDECINFIFQEVQKSGCNGFADEEIFGMAVHYFDEDNLGKIQETRCRRVVVNHAIELTEQEKAEARERAIQKYHDEEYNRLKAKPSKSIKPSEKKPEATLFDFDEL